MLVNIKLAKFVYMKSFLEGEEWHYKGVDYLATYHTFIESHDGNFTRVCKFFLTCKELICNIIRIDTATKCKICKNKYGYKVDIDT